jgi:hypothetical protein
VAKWWLDGRRGLKTVIGVALDNSVAAKSQFQLPSVFFRLSQFLDPCLYLPYCVKQGTIEDLNIAFSGDVGFRVTQDALYDFVLGPNFIQVRRKSPPKRVPTRQRPSALFSNLR